MAKQAGISFEQLALQITNKQFNTVYFFEGEEPYYIDALADLLEANVLQDVDKEFNQTILYGKDVDSARIISEATRYPMMAEKQLVIVREAQEVRDLDKLIPAKVNNKQTEVNLLDEYIKNPQATTVLVICYKYKKLDARKALAKNIKQFSQYYLSAKLYENQLPAWLNSYCKQQQITTTPMANTLLCEYLGNDLQKMINEISKLLLNKKGSRNINETDVQENIGISKEYNIFELQSALGVKDVLKCNKIINYFAANKKDAPLVVVVASLFSYFTKVLLYNSLKDKKEAASVLKINPYFVKDYEIAAKNYSFEKCVRIVSLLRETDAKSKGVESAPLEDGELLKEVIFKILH